MWTLQPRSELERLAAALALLVAVGGALRLEELGDRLRREEHRAWWASNGRDVINAAALVVVSGALALLGFPGPAALVAGGLVTLALMGISSLEDRVPARLRPQLLAMLLGLSLAAPLLTWPEGVVEGLGALAATLFPH